MDYASAHREWSGESLGAPFSWEHGQDVLVVTDLFDSEYYHLFADEPFAVMAYCPQHRFRLKTAFPERFHSYVRTITKDRKLRLSWRMTACSVLEELGRWKDAIGHGPEWPLKNVELASLN